MRGFAGREPQQMLFGEAPQDTSAVDVHVTVRLAPSVSVDDIMGEMETHLRTIGGTVTRYAFATGERNRAKAEAVTDRAIAVASMKADPDWLALVRESILRVAIATAEFTSDDVWDDVEATLVFNPHIEAPKDRQAAGGVFRSLARDGVIVDTMRSKRSERPKAHSKKLTVWRLA